LKQIIERSDDNIQQRECRSEAQEQNQTVERLERIQEHIDLPDPIKDIKRVAQDFRGVNMYLNDHIKINLDVILDKFEQNKPIGKKDVVNLHTDIFGSKLAFALYSMQFLNTLPLELQTYKKEIEKAISNKREFWQTLGDFITALDKTFPSWKYEDSEGRVYDSGRLLPDDQNNVENLTEENLKNLKTTHRMLGEVWEVLSKRLDSTLEPSQYLKSHKEKQENSEKEKPEYINKKNARPDNKLRSSL
jgi:hypothetical protein